MVPTQLVAADEGTGLVRSQLRAKHVIKHWKRSFPPPTPEISLEMVDVFRTTIAEDFNNLLNSWRNTALHLIGEE